MHVVHFVKRFSVLTETFIYDQIQRVDSLVDKSTVVTETRLNQDQRPFASVIEVTLKRFLSDYIDSRLAYKFNLLPLFIKKSIWRRYISQLKPDVVHCHAGNAARTFYHIARLTGYHRPVLVSLHGSDVTWEPNVRPGYKKDLKRLAENYNVLFTVPSEFLKQKVKDNLGINSNQVVVVRNGVNPAFCSISAMPITDNKVVCIGRFIDCKGQADLIDAFNSLLKDYPKASLTLIGTGPNKSILKNRALSYGISSQVEFIDRVPHHELPNFLRQFKVYVQPSIKDPRTQQEESFGVAALEAGACGLKVIVSRSGGLPEAISNLSGFTRLFDPGNSDQLRLALKEAFEDNSKPTGISELDTQSVNAKNIMNLYKKLLAANEEK